MATEDAFNFLDFSVGTGSKLDDDFLKIGTMHTSKPSHDLSDALALPDLLDSDSQRGSSSAFSVHVPRPVTPSNLFISSSFVPLAPIAPVILSHFPKGFDGIPRPLSSPKPQKTQTPSSTVQSDKKSRKSENRGRKVHTNQVERATARKEKHRLIDRARRKRVKNSIDQLRELVRLEPHEKADKATIVSSAVREIQDLKSQIAKLQEEVTTTVLNPPYVTVPSDHEAIIPAISDKALETKFPSIPINIPATSFFGGLGGAGVCISVIGLDCKLRDVNGLFETITGFRREELIGKRWIDPPLYGRHVHGEFPSNFVRSPDPRFAWVPTASQNDFSCDDFKRAVNALVHGGTFKVVSRVLTRDGSILESLQTIFLMRGESNALTAVSTPDTRRLIHLPPDSLEFTSVPPSPVVPSPVVQPKSSFIPEDFLKNLPQ